MTIYACDAQAAPQREIAVYMGSALGSKPQYAQLARDFARRLANEGYDMVFGGCGVGLMGEVATTALACGARVTGVLPDFSRMQNVRCVGLSGYIEVDTVSERKLAMLRRACAYVALPGGPGTIDEICEVIALTKAGIQRKPCVLLNVNGFYEPLRAQYELMLREGFVTPEELSPVLFSDSLDETFAFINAHEGGPSSASGAKNS